MLPFRHPEDAAAGYLDAKPTSHLRSLLRETRSHPSPQGPGLGAISRLHLLLADSLREERQPGRPSHHTLPHLCIPTHGHTSESITPDTSETVTPSTPASISSPIAGVIDLTSSIQTLNESPVTTGGFFDIYKGEWTREATRSGKSQEKVLVAIKLLRVFAIREHEKARKRLNWEVYIWHRLEHPNIVKFFGTSYHLGGRPSMVMQWYKNSSATDYTVLYKSTLIYKYQNFGDVRGPKERLYMYQ
ncbi:hypothetical protein FPV67DRAFT_1682643 [Lyophyllum atratum]|nr:hypothetical protein FPV67DRAFT_1682643 [Lyophyllum atratum]